MKSASGNFYKCKISTDDEKHYMLINVNDKIDKEHIRDLYVVYIYHVSYISVIVNIS